MIKFNQNCLIFLYLFFFKNFVNIFHLNKYKYLNLYYSLNFYFHLFINLLLV